MHSGYGVRAIVKNKIANPSARVDRLYQFLARLCHWMRLIHSAITRRLFLCIAPVCLCVCARACIEFFVWNRQRICATYYCQARLSVPLCLCVSMPFHGFAFHFVLHIVLAFLVLHCLAVGFAFTLMLPFMIVETFKPEVYGKHIYT